MKLIKSELILEDFFIINSKYNFIEPSGDYVDLKKLINDYQIDIDFIVRGLKDENDKYVVLAKVNINDQKDNLLPGYSLFAESVSIYSFDKNSKLNEKEKSDFLWHSGVSISINSLRNYLSAMTSYFPLGKYSLPSVDLTQLLKLKRDFIASKKSKMKSTKESTN